MMLSCTDDSKLAYVDINTLYESFEYKKEMTQEFNVIKTARQRILDSLDLELNQISKSANTLDKNQLNVLETKQNYLIQITRQFEEENSILVGSYNERIMKQLNAYIDEYGKKNGYKFIYGADNKGSLLYADKKLNITEKVVEFVNERFKGEKVK